ELATVYLPALYDVDGDFMIDEMSGLSTLSLGALHRVARYVHLHNFGGAGLMVSMPALDTVGTYFYAGYCTNLSSLTMPSLATVGTYIQITNNGSLQTINFPAITSVGGRITIDANNQLLAIHGFDNAAFTAINGEFVLNEGNNSYLLTTLDAFSNVTTINGNLRLYRTQALTSLAGFEKLETVTGHLVIEDMEGLANLDFLAGLTDIGGHLHIVGNGALTSIEGLSTLQNVGIESGSEEGLIIEDNDNVSFADLDGLQGLETIGGTLRINGNQNLSTFLSTATCTITSLGRDFRLYDNPFLTNLTGLNIATTVRDLSVNANERLTSLEGLNDITGVTRDLSIGAGNTQLSQLDFTALLSVGRHISIDDTNLASLSGFSNLASVGGNL
ncbi:MAG: hypothetical protein Q8M76_02305, partial [Spirochaetaceae bacterium]|nr:hypothetical protein [Spirochaetaceae bacterium]